MKIKLFFCPLLVVTSVITLLGLATASSAQNAIKSTIISRDVVVEDGDTLQSLAQRELGRVGFAPYLAEFNALVLTAPLVAGNIVRIPIHVPARGEFAEVVFVKGDVRTISTTQPDNSASGVQVASSSGALPAANALPLVRNAKVLAGDIIITGPDGYVSIAFSTGSVINLQPDTEASLQKLNCLPKDDSCSIEIIAQRGKVTSDVESRDNQPVDFRIKTPYASAAVRGTIFDVDAGEKLILGVTEGDVDVNAEGTLVSLERGFGSLVEAGQAPSEPIELLPPPIFKRIPVRVALGDSVSWWPYDKARSYRAFLTTDAAGNETLADFNIEANDVGFGDTQSGVYFLTVRAIDENGLRGFTSNTRVTLADIDPAVTPVETVISRQGQEYLVTVQDPAESALGYEIQISSDNDFRDPLTVDVSEIGAAVFRIDADQVYARARVLLDPFTVSSFGGIASSQ